jgi:exosome complex RNA-binding protein Rrp42 (RNase PH superfamily)
MADSALRQRHVAGLISHGSRPDGRGFADSLPLALECGTVFGALGSATVSRPNTIIVAAVTGELFAAAKSPVELTRGRIECTVAKSPLCDGITAQRFAAQRSLRALSLELEQVVSTLIDSSQLRYEHVSGEEPQLWRLTVDVIVLACDSPIYDAVLLAVTAALMDTKLPVAVPDDSVSEASRTLSLHTTPVACTVVLFETLTSPESSVSAPPQLLCLVDPTPLETDALALVTELSTPSTAATDGTGSDGGASWPTASAVISATYALETGRLLSWTVIATRSQPLLSSASVRQNFVAAAISGAIQQKRAVLVAK